MDKKIDIKITFHCNNRCDFCAQGSKREYIKPKEFKEIISALKSAIKDGIRYVVFTGGEPTLHPDILTIVSEARRLGFNRVQLQTNGRTLSDERFLKELIKSGVTEVSPALHGPNDKIHDALTHAPGSFKQTVAGIINAKKNNLYVLTNTVVTSVNYKYLPEIAKLLVYLKVNQFQFAFIHIVGRGWDNREWIVPKKTDVMPYIYKGLDVGLKAGIPCYTEAIPYCLMRGYEQCVAERMIPDGPVVDANLFLENFGDYRRNEGKVKRDECKKCVYYNVCEGPWKEYPDIYGWDEFKPVLKKCEKCI